MEASFVPSSVSNPLVVIGLFGECPEFIPDSFSHVLGSLAPVTQFTRYFMLSYFYHYHITMLCVLFSFI